MTLDPYWPNVVLAMPMEGAHNSTTFTDYSKTPKTITRYGNAIISTAQSKWGNGSGYFDGSTDHLTVSAHADFQLGTGDFTIECFVRPIPASSSSYARIVQFGGNSAGGGLYFVRAETANPFTFFVQGHNGSSYFNLIGPNGLTASNSAFTHLALTRSGNVFRMFVGGVNTNTGTTTAYSITQTTVYIASNPGGTEAYAGYIQDLCITKGTAKYTANFTPPAEPLFINRGTISGTVYEKNSVGVYVPGAYPVRAYQRSNGALLASTTSAVDGSYTLQNVPMVDSNSAVPAPPLECYVVALDSAATWQSPGLAEQVFAS